MLLLRANGDLVANILILHPFLSWTGSKLISYQKVLNLWIIAALTNLPDLFWLYMYPSFSVLLNYGGIAVEFNLYAMLQTLLYCIHNIAYLLQSFN